MVVAFWLVKNVHPILFENGTPAKSIYRVVDVTMAFWRIVDLPWA